MRRHGKILPEKPRASMLPDPRQDPARGTRGRFAEILQRVRDEHREVRRQGCRITLCPRPHHAMGVCRRHYAEGRELGHFAEHSANQEEHADSCLSERARETSAVLLGQASIDVFEARNAGLRDDVDASQQRLLDLFRVLHSHRHGDQDLSAVGRHAGLEDRAAAFWVDEVTTAAPEGADVLGLRGRSADFAWLLGLYAAIRRSPAGGKPRPLRVRLTPAEADELSGVMTRLFDRPPTIREVDDQCDVFFGSKELSRYLHDVSAGNTRIPWEHLATPEERRAFLASFLQRRCSLSAIGGVRPILAIGKRMAPSLRDGLLMLFSQLGIYPAFDESRIFLQALPELQKVIDAGLLTDDERRERLDDLVKSAPYDSLDIDVDLYYRVLGGEESDLVPAETRRRWFLDELPPKIKRLERIATICAEDVDPDALGLLYRGLDMTSDKARDLAGKHTLRSLLVIVETLRDSKVPRETWSSWIEMTPQEIKNRLGGKDSPVLIANGQEYRLTPKARMRYIQAYGLQPSEFEDFTICLDHIQSELQAALDNAELKGKLASSSLVFSIQDDEIQSIRLVSHG